MPRSNSLNSNKYLSQLKALSHQLRFYLLVWICSKLKETMKVVLVQKNFSPLKQFPQTISKEIIIINLHFNLCQQILPLKVSRLLSQELKNLNLLYKVLKLQLQRSMQFWLNNKLLLNKMQQWPPNNIPNLFMDCSLGIILTELQPISSLSWCLNKWLKFSMELPQWILHNFTCRIIHLLSIHLSMKTVNLNTFNLLSHSMLKLLCNSKCSNTWHLWDITLLINWMVKQLQGVFLLAL